MAFAITAVISAVLVPIKELNSGVHQWMTALTGHHWVTHGMLELILFLLLALVLLPFAARIPSTTVVASVVGGLVIGAGIITTFFAFA